MQGQAFPLDMWKHENSTLKGVFWKSQGWHTSLSSRKVFYHLKYLKKYKIMLSYFEKQNILILF